MLSRPVADDEDVVEENMMRAMRRGSGVERGELLQTVNLLKQDVV